MGTPKSTTATTTPTGLTVGITYNGSTTPPTNAGSYAVVAIVTDANYQGTASGTMVIAKATAWVILSNLSHTYDGTPKSATATTTPSGLTVTITYGGSTTAPTNAGSYAIVATITNANYQGTASSTLVIGKANQTYGDPDFTVNATASSGLPVSFTASGACTVSGNTVHISGVGSCTITAYQAGNSNYNAAPDVSQTFTVNTTYERLGDLVKQLVTNKGIANSLLTKLDNVRKAEAKGNTDAKVGMIGAFINEVEAQTGKAISPEQAAILISLAKAL